MPAIAKTDKGIRHYCRVKGCSHERWEAATSLKVLCPKHLVNLEWDESTYDWQDDERLFTVSIAHDPHTYPIEKGTWLDGRTGISTDEARRIQATNKVRGEHHKRSKQGGRIKASIPAALFHARRKMHGMDYFKDPKVQAKLEKDWGVGR